MAISAFIVPVPSAEVLAGDLRRRFDATTELGVPAHITSAVAAELQDRLDAFGAVTANCTSVVLIENSTGRWEEMHAFGLSKREL